MSRLQTIRFYGDCLEALGIPDGGTLTYDRDLTPRVLDLVVCEDPQSSLQPYFKQLLRTGEDKIVTTCYKDRSRNFAMRTPSITGVVTEVRDGEGRIVYRRRNRSKADDLRALDDRGLALFMMRMTDCTRCSLTGSLFPEDPETKCAACFYAWLEWLRQESAKEDP